MKATLRRAFEAEMESAHAARRSGEFALAFEHLERAHILGQQFVGPHVRAHLEMLRIGIARRDLREIAGQLVRIPAALAASTLGVAPNGNPGGADVGFFDEREIPEELKRLLDAE